MSNQDQFSGSCGDNGNSESLLIENSPLKKAKIEIECEDIDNIDRISQLPEALIGYGRSNSSTVHKFISLTDNVLPLLSCSTIKRFSLNFVFRYDDGVSYFPKIDKWLEFAMNKKVEDLLLNICYIVDPTEHDKPYSLQEVLCNSSSILKLNCENCRILEDCVLNWTSLKSSTLENLFLHDEHIKQIMSNCPQLKSLKLQEFCGFNRLHMTSPKCRRLHLIHHDHPCGDRYSFEGDICCFEIVAPHIEHLTISGVFNHTKIKLGDLLSLKQANLDLICDEFNEMDEHIVKDLLVSVPCANELILSSWFIKVISNLMLEEEDVSLSLLECRWLTITFVFQNFCSPTRQPLKVDSRGTCLPTNLSLRPKKKVLVFQQFLKFLLEHAINLEKLVIVLEHKECNRCSTNTSYDE
ncbi:hypothetical protein H5410_005274, partial [Solanum commersonii]